jgi:hypothetical protein
LGLATLAGRTGALFFGPNSEMVGGFFRFGGNDPLIFFFGMSISG